MDVEYQVHQEFIQMWRIISIGLKIQKKNSMAISITISTGTTRMIQTIITAIQASD